MELLDLNDYVSKVSKSYEYLLVVFYKFTKFGWTIPLKNKNAETMKDSIENILKTAKRKPNLFGTDDGKKLLNKNLNEFLKLIKIENSCPCYKKSAILRKNFTELLETCLKTLFFKKVTLI